MKLLSMVEFVLLKKEDTLDKDVAEIHQAYARFLKQKSEISMYIPCDLEGNILEKPKTIEYDVFSPVRMGFHDKQVVAYNEAKKRVLFNIPRENIEVDDDVIFINDRNVMISKKSGHLISHKTSCLTLEEIANFKGITFYLSEISKKSIGL